MLLWMQIYDILQTYLFLFYLLERTIFIPKREAANYIRLMTPTGQSDSNELGTQRPVTSLTDAAWSDWLPWTPPLQMSAYLVMGNIPDYGKTFRSEANFFG